MSTAQKIREAGDEVHDLVMRLAEEISGTGPDLDELALIIDALSGSPDSPDVTATLVASGVEAFALFDLMYHTKH